MPLEANRDPGVFSQSPLEYIWGDGIFPQGKILSFLRQFPMHPSKDSGAWVACRDLLDIHLYGVGTFLLLWISSQDLGSVFCPS